LENEESKNGTDEIKERRQALESKREALLTRLKKIDAQAKYKSYEAKALQTVLKGKPRPDARSLRRKLEYLEFKIETEATTLQLERQLMKEIKKTQKELEEAFAGEKQFRKLSYLESDLREYEKEMNQIERDLQDTHREMSELEKSNREEAKRKAFEVHEKKRLEFREKKRKEIHEEQKKETDPFMATLEPTVSLEDICVIRKKIEKTEEGSEE